MSLFFSKRGERRDMEPWAPLTGTSRRTVSADTAATLASYFAAHRHLVDFVSTLPLDAYRHQKGGSRVEISPPRLISGLDEPGRPGRQVWLGQAMHGILNTGNAVGWIAETDGFGFPTSVRWMARPDWSFNEWSHKWYAFGAEVPSSRIMHIPWIVPPGKTLGLSPLELFAAVINAGLSAQEYADIRRGGGVPPSILKNVEKVLDRSTADAIKKRLISALSKGEPFVTGKDWDYQGVAIPPNHQHFIETMKLTGTQIAAIYGIDPTEVGAPPPGNLTYQNEEHRHINRAANARPYIERLEAGINRVLPERQFIKLNVDATIRADIKTRTAVIGQQLADGRLSVNEARALDDRQPIGPAGDRYNVPAPKADSTTREGDSL